VKIRRDGGDRLAFAAPPLLKSGPLPESDVALIARGLGVGREDILHHAWCDNGPSWRAVMLPSAEQVLALVPNSALAGLDVGVIGPRDPDAECAFEVRAFFPARSGMTEDPVTGSLNAALAEWLIGAGLAPSRYVAAQGAALGRAGRVHAERAPDGQVWIGGASVTCVDGRVTL
jgi:PhzF family phenazine biosynthesis protein